jgi:hypothetical protein
MTVIDAGLTTREVIAISTIEDADVDNPNSPIHPDNRARTGMTAQGKYSRSDLPDLDTIYANIVLGNDVSLYDGSITGIPLADGFPDVALPDQAQWIDLTVNPKAGSFWRGFTSAFKTLKN